MSLGTYKSASPRWTKFLSFFVTMKFTTGTVLVFLATLATAVSGAPLPVTNAERLARGLNPNPPVVRREGTPAYGMLSSIENFLCFFIHCP